MDGYRFDCGVYCLLGFKDLDMKEKLFYYGLIGTIVLYVFGSLLMVVFGVAMRYTDNPIMKTLFFLSLTSGLMGLLGIIAYIYEWIKQP